MMVLLDLSLDMVVLLHQYYAGILSGPNKEKFFQIPIILTFIGMIKIIIPIC